MADLLLFHSALGSTPGCRAFADDLRAAGHRVHLPDLYEGAVFGDLAEGVAHAEALGMQTVVERARRAAEGLPPQLVYAGLSLGVLPAQALAQTRAGALAAVLLHACVPPEAFGTPWPDGVRAQVHVMADDEHGDVAVARELAATADGVELFLYPGDQHLFTDRGLPAYDAAAAGLVLERVLLLLSAVDGSV